MAKTFCLTQDQIQTLKEAMKRVGGTRLTNMTFTEIEDLFMGVTNNEKMALDMAKGFKLASISQKKNALHNWLVKNLTPEEVKTHDREIPMEKMEILLAYKNRMEEIKQDFEAGKIDNEEKKKQAIKAKEDHDTKQKKVLTNDEKAKANIERLHTKLTALREGTYTKSQKRERTAEELAIQKEIDAEFKKLDVEVYTGMDKDRIERALGTQLTESEIENINFLAQGLQEEGDKEADTFSGYSDAFFDRQQEIELYLNTVAPMTNLEVISSTIFRGVLLFSIKSPLLNIVSNTTGGTVEASAEALYQVYEGVKEGERIRVSGVNADLIGKYRTYALKIYKKTGTDVVRSLQFSHSQMSVLGERFKGVGSGDGAIRSTGRFMQEYVFKLGQGYADVAFASTHFAHKVDIESTKVADRKMQNSTLTGEAFTQEHKRMARDIFTQAMSLKLDETDPEHADAIMVKLEAVRYAFIATYQNDGAFAKALLDIRRQIDDYTGGLMLGTNFVAPFIKTVANFGMLSAETSGATLPFAIARFAKAHKAGDVETVKRSIKTFTRAGMGMLIAVIFASLVDDEDYMPDYITSSRKEKELAQTQGIPYNSIRIGDKWVSLVYFGTAGWAISGYLSAKRSSSTGDAVLSYFGNSFLQMSQMPVLNTVFNTGEYLYSTQQYNKSFEDVLADTELYLSNFILSRTIPAIVSDIAKSIDQEERVIDKKQDVGGIVLDTLKNKVPFARETLPIKYNALGDPMSNESVLGGFAIDLLFGARVKTAPTDTEVYGELVRLSSQGQQVKLDFNQIGDVKVLHGILDKYEYNEFSVSLQRSLNTGLSNVMSTTDYKSADDEKKKELLMKVRDGLVQKKLYEFGYSSRVREEKRKQKQS